jgi:hypothetical protein
MAARFRVRWLAAWHDVTKVRAYVGGVFIEVKQIRRWTKIGNQFSWKTVYLKGGFVPPADPPPTTPPTNTPVTLSVSIDPTTCSGALTGPGTVPTGTVTAKKGTAPYTYKWSRVSYDAPVAPVIVHSSQQDTNFSQVVGTAPVTYNAKFRCTVTDSKGNKGSATVTAKFITFAAAGGGGGIAPNPDDYYNRDGTEQP